MRWFGEPWPSRAARAPVCEDDRDRIETPVGSECLFCSELIDEHDRGEEIAGGPWGVAYVHVECVTRSVLGGPAHLLGRCTCQGGTDDPDLGMTPREAAVWVWERYGLGEVER